MCYSDSAVVLSPAGAPLGASVMAAPVYFPHERGGPMALDQFPDFLTVEEAASVLRIGRSLAYQLARQWRVTGGRSGLPVIDLGHKLRVPRAALARMMDARSPAGSDR